MAPKPPTAPGILTPGLKNACLNAGITLDDLCSCIKRLQHGKSPGIDGIVADMMINFKMIRRWWRPVERVLVVAVQLRACQPLP